MAREQGRGVSFGRLLMGGALTLAAAACIPGEDGVDGGQGDSCGSRGQPQCDRGEFCNFPVSAACGSFDAPGTCEPIPQVCTKEYAPVCGCDGVTYGNACMAAAAGASVQASGECGGAPDGGVDGGGGETDAGATSCGGLIGAGCAAGEFCDYPIDALCGAADQTGVCRPTPDVCPQVELPVCGCDGKTYGNACKAASAGVSVSAEGACKDAGGGDGVGSFCGGFAGIQCPGELYCSFPVATQCGSGDQGGTCQRKPEACTLQYDPVCGCDGNTYGNACAAAGAGVSIAHDGPC